MMIRGNTIGTALKPETVMIRCTNLTEEGKAKARENIGVVPMLVVTYDEYGKASHTAGEIYAHVQAGGMVVFDSGSGIYATPAGIQDNKSQFIAYEAHETGDGIVAVGVIYSFEIDMDGNATCCAMNVIHSDGIDGIICEKIEDSVKGVTEEYKEAIKKAEDAGYKKAVETFCPKLEMTARLVQCYPVAGYPISVSVHDYIGNVVVCGKNLYDKESYPLDTDGYPYSGTSNSGMLTNSNNYKRTDFIPVDHLRGQTITLSHPPIGTNPGISFYIQIPDGKGTEEYTKNCKDAWCGGTTGASIKVPDEAKYMVFSVNKENATANVQIEIGSKSTEYEEYRANVYSDFEINSGKFEPIVGCNTIYTAYEACAVNVLCREDISALVRKMQNYISMG